MNVTWTWTGLPATLDEIQAQVYPGWHPILARLVDDLLSLGWDGQVTQVKEKFGGLQFYIKQKSDVLRDRIHVAQEEAYRTCEICGRPGLPRSGGWIKTLCDEHASERPVWTC